MTPRIAKTLVVAVVLAALPPTLNRVAYGVFSDFWALTVGIGVAFAMGALSLNLLMGYAGQISLGHAALLGVGAFTSGILTGRGLEVPFFVGVIAAAVVGGLVALLIGLPALRIRGLYLAIVTIGFGLMVENSLFLWRPVSGGSAGLELPKPRAGDFVFTKDADYLALALLLFVGLWVIDQNVLRTKLGRAFHGIREDEAVAQSFGVDVVRYKLLAFVISGAMAGIAGAVLGHLVTFVESRTFQFNVSLALVIMVVVGGLGSRTGAVASALAFTILPRLFDPLEQWAPVIGALGLIYVMAAHPGGMAEAVREARDRKAAKRAREGGEEEESDELPKLPALPRPTGLPERRRVKEGAALLECRDVSVRFGGLQAVDEASLDVHPGRIVGLIGPNGAGKTTLFNAISGFVATGPGSISLAGEEIGDLAPHERARRGIGRTFQLIGLAQNLSVEENFLLAQHVVAGYDIGSALGHLPRAARVERELRDRAAQAIAALGFDRFTDTPVKHLSHGQKRLVELGCSLVTAPELLLLDEPSAGMAPGAAENLAERLRDIRDELGRTVLLIEHNIPLVLDVCDYLYVLNFGQVLAHGTTDEIANRPDVLAAYFGEHVTEEAPA